MTKLSEYLNMSGYGVFVWPSYILAFSMIMILVIFVILRKKRIEKKIQNFINKNQNEKQ